jgi:hypothetical protein
MDLIRFVDWVLPIQHAAFIRQVYRRRQILNLPNCHHQLLKIMQMQLSERGGQFCRLSIIAALSSHQGA